MGSFDRVQNLIGKENLSRLNDSAVAIFGIGGVGGYAVESLVRSGVGKIIIIDNDKVSQTNVNRQIIADTTTIGKYKTDVMKDRLLKINPELKVETINLFVLPENISEIDFSGIDYVIDAVDTVSAKICIIEKAKSQGIKVISCMGTGGKLNPLDLRVEMLNKTTVCPLARVMRRELKKRNIEDVKVVYSIEEKQDKKIEQQSVELKGKDRIAPPSMIFVPATAGLLLANQVIKDLIG